MSSTDKRAMLRHFLATLAYRGTNVLRDMPEEVQSLRPDPSVRTPIEILGHINGVLTYAHSHMAEYESTRPPPADWSEEVSGFIAILTRVDASLRDEVPLTNVKEEQLLQGPLADAMLHLVQIGIFRRLAGAPVEPESYIRAPIQIGRIEHPG